MENVRKLAELRAKIDVVDEQLLALLNTRAQLALKVRIAKGSDTAYRPEREAEVLRQITDKNSGPLSNEAIRTMFTSIIYVCRAIQDIEIKESDLSLLDGETTSAS